MKWGIIMLRNLLNMSEKGPQGSGHRHLEGLAKQFLPEVNVMGTLRIKVNDCAELVDAFVQSSFSIDHQSFFRSFERSLIGLNQSLSLLDTLGKETRQYWAAYFLGELREKLGVIVSLVNLQILSFEETVLSRALYRQIETRLRILAGPGNREVWEGPVPSNNRSNRSIEEESG